MTPQAAFVLSRADDALVLGHRLSEWCGHAPTPEEDIALANMGLDLLGQARSLYQHAGHLLNTDEDQLAYSRDSREYLNLLLLEQPSGDFAHTIARQFLYAAFIDPWWRALTTSPDPALSAIAAKAEKETAYHLRHASEWLIRLGDGTLESHRRAQAALDHLWTYTGELFEPDPHGPDLAPIRAEWDRTIDAILSEATLTRPADAHMQRGGRAGRHTDHLGFLLATMQSVARAHPGAVW